MPQTAKSPFERYSDRDVRFLIESCPLAWVVPADRMDASLLPLVGVFDNEDRLVELIGHFARTNPLSAALARNRAATILFTGPHAYISPAQAGKRDWAPTWNYAEARLSVDISIEPELTAAAVDLLIEHVEDGAETPWRASELGPRRAQLMAHIVGFRARVTECRARFKLGQDERPETWRAITSAIGDSDLSMWMRRFNPSSGKLQDAHHHGQSQNLTHD